MTCIAFFALQAAFSHWWLARFRFGPMEWVWRALTYGERPQFRISPRTPVLPCNDSSGTIRMSAFDPLRTYWTVDRVSCG
ncbi:MAG: DUF418 domain-containing protein [Sphingomonas sp.]|nr:DUF418 domain-containing protein [Sphingomonas sp.]